MNNLQLTIEKALNEGMATFGVRVMTSKPDGNDVVLSVGDCVEDSYEWDDGITTDEQLGGVSTIGFDVDPIDGEINIKSFNSAISDISQYGDGQVVIVGGQHNIDAIHNDIGEVVIKDAVVVAVIK